MDTDRLKVEIHEIKAISDLTFELPLTPGLYAITGHNGAGKSTMVTCASTVFFNIPMNAYFGSTDDKAYIRFCLGDTTREWHKHDGKWRRSTSETKMEINGFYEGSVIYGNRFRNTDFENISKIEKITDKDLAKADDFIRDNLGEILHGDKTYYECLYKLSTPIQGLKGDIFFFDKGDRRVSQFHMSTGENLLISVLNALCEQQKRNRTRKFYLVFLDEIELALHPSSLKRLVKFLKNYSNRNRASIYFSTHSIELINALDPHNIFYLERHGDNKYEIINPCYPAYATKYLYDHTGFDQVILVEDDLARAIVHRIIREHRLINNQLIHILPCGGWTNVLALGNEVVNTQVLGRAAISIILDKDVKNNAEDYIIRNQIVNGIPLNFLPIKSLEKYLRESLVMDTDIRLFRELSNYLFLRKPLKDITDAYRNTQSYMDDKKGKEFYNLLDAELREQGKSRADLIEMVTDHLFRSNPATITSLIDFLKERLA